MIDRAAPNLPSRDFDVTVAFYGGFGFEPSYRGDGWLILRRGELQLEFFAFPAFVPEESSFMCSVRVDDVDEPYRQIQQSGVEEKSVGRPRLHTVRLQPWGLRAGFLVDPAKRAEIPTVRPAMALGVPESPPERNRHPSETPHPEVNSVDDRVLRNGRS